MGASFYSYSLFGAWVLLSFLGGNLLLCRLPGDVPPGYVRARRILGVAYYAFALQIFLQWAFSFRTSAPKIATALNFSCFYLAAFLFGMSFISLLNSSYISRRRVMFDAAKYVLCLVMAWTGAFIPSPLWSMVLLSCTAVLFCVDALRITVIFFRTYRDVTRKVDDYYSDDVAVFVKWLSKSTYAVVVFGLSCTVMAFASQLAIGIYMFMGIFVFDYIYNSFQNYLLHYAEVKTATDDMPAPAPTVDSVSVDVDRVAERIRHWKSHHGFCQPGITIEALAVWVGTNRTYLAALIKREANVSFREWITLQRIEYSKLLLKSRKDLSISDIAGYCGYSSGSYFIRLFSSRENMTPVKWREEYFLSIAKDPIRMKR